MRSLLIGSLHAAYRDGVSPADVIGEIFPAIKAAADPGIFICLVKPADALKAAKALGEFNLATKPLWGVPFAVKDNIDVAGMPTTAGCPDFSRMPAETAFALQRLIDAGAILIGKTNLDQFATGLVGVRTPYPVPRNAVDPELVPGGSSSGSAVAVARGLVTFALGTDTAGSGRVPAALNNIVGLKPSLGLFSSRGVVPACRTLDCISIFALTADDAWQAAGVMAAYDALDPYSRRVPLGTRGVPPTIRIGWPSSASLEFYGDRYAEAAFAGAKAGVAELGFDIQEVDLGPFREVAELLYGGPWVAERYQAIREFIETSPASLHPVTRQIISGATRLSAADAFAGLYRLAGLSRATEDVWRRIDVMAVPTIPAVYTRTDLEVDPIGPNTRLGTYTNFVNLLDLCAFAVPSGLRSDGRPTGVTLIAPAGRDALLASLGARVHEQADVKLGATAQRLPKSPELPPSAPAGWIEIAAVGAHMSGLPLNHELTGLGGIFQRQAKTSPSYRLYALPGGPPARPGLLRTANGEGHELAVEVWAMPAAGFGSFVAGIPAPLTIGTLHLADGTSPKGFLVEAQGVTGARDISQLGGWRSYLASQRR
jgi:allophanate hydrolase